MSSTTSFRSPVKSAFIPPKFGNIGKNSKDLFKKKFDFVNQLKIVNRSAQGVTFESGILADSAPLNGYVRGKLNAGTYEVEVEAQTEANRESKLTIRAPRLYSGLVTSASAAAVGKTVKYGADFEFVRESLTLTGEASSDLDTHKARVTASAGIDGITVGGSVDANLTSGADISDYAVGVEYLAPQFAASVWTENRLDTANVSYYHKLSSNHAVGALAKVDIAGAKTPSVTIGNDYVVDANTSVKFKVEAPTGITAAAIEHRLVDPKVLVALAASFSPLNFAKGFKADKFGASFTFGDY